MSKSAIIVMLCVLFLLKGEAVAGYVDHGNETVTDTIANLTWQQCSAGLSGAGCAAGTAATYAWEDAISYCEDLSLGGFADWRLPNGKELFSLEDAETDWPSIDTSFFPATLVLLPYWTSTSVAHDTTLAWYVHFGGGELLYDVRTSTYYVRCVRGQ